MSIQAALQALPCRWLWEAALTTGSDVTVSEPWRAYSIESSVPGCAQTWSLRRNLGNCSTARPCKLPCKLVVGSAVPKGKCLFRNNQTSKRFQYLVKFLIGGRCYYLHVKKNKPRKQVFFVLFVCLFSFFLLIN